MDQSPKATIDIAKEKVNVAVEVAPDFWIIATRHRPGGSRHMPEINNRCLIFRLRDASAGGAPTLLVVNAVDPAVLPEVRRIEKETGLEVGYLVSPGGGHSLHLAEWHDALHKARILVGPARIPRIAAGKKLKSSPRFAAFDGDDPLPQFRGEVEFVNFDGLLGFRENVSAKEGGKDSPLGLIKMMLTEMPPKDPTDELWLYHVPTRSIFAGENLGWILSKEQHAGMGFMMKMMMKPEQVAVMTGPRKVADAGRVRAHWRKILAWPAENVFTFHDTIGTGQVGGGQAALKAAVEKAKQA
jgi:hypothetical protein